jgi:hypothetical protein
MDVATAPPSPEHIEAMGMVCRQIEATGMVCRMAGYARRNCRLEPPLGGRRSTTRVTRGPTSKLRGSVHVVK